MNKLLYFSIGCKVRLVDKATEYAVGGEELEHYSVTKDMREQTYIVAWVGRFILRVRIKGVDIYFATSDVTIVE